MDVDAPSHHPKKLLDHEHVEAKTCGLEPLEKRFRYNLPVPADVVAYGEAYDALCEGKGGRVLAECACTSGYKESVNASDATEMFLCVPEECRCGGDGSKVDIPQLVQTPESELYMAHLKHLCQCAPPTSCDCATDFMETETSMVYTAPYRPAEARGCVPKKCTCGDGVQVDAPSSRVYMEPMVELLNRVLEEKITLPRMFP